MSDNDPWVDHARRTALFVPLVLALLGSQSAFASVAVTDTSTGADIFTASPVCRIELELAPRNFESLRFQPRKHVRANLRASGEFFHDVGIHLKGSTGSFRGIDDNKPGFTLDFDRFVRGQRFRGLQQIHLNNSVEDPTYLKEQIGSEMFHAARLPAPRVAHALVALNGRPLGLYVLKEGFTEEFLARHFDHANGHLYDTDRGHDVNLRMKRHLGHGATDDQADLHHLASAALETDPRRRWERLQQTLDADKFLTFMAMEIMICHWDGYCLGRNNFRIYHNPGDERMVFLPSGMDQLFAKPDMPWKPGMAGLVAQAIMEVPDGRKQYEARFRALFKTVFLAERLTNRVNQLLAELRPFVENAEFENMRQESAELCGQIAEREVYLRKQLNDPDPVIPPFLDEVTALGGWKIAGELGEGSVQETNNPGEISTFRIVAGPKTAASWRTTVRLSRGNYVFRGKAKVTNVTPLPFGKNQGASLRVGDKMKRSAELLGTAGWEALATAFEVSAPEEEVVLICELRASAGEACFERDSLLLSSTRAVTQPC